MSESIKPISILVCALGGEGGGVFAEWLVTAARIEGYYAQGTSIPGVAQRTGATTYYVEIYPEKIESLNSRRPILSLYPVKGDLDVLVSSELLETARQAGTGMLTREKTSVISSTSRTLTTNEKMALGDGRLGSDELMELVRSNSKSLIHFDMDRVAAESGTVISSVLLGALVGSGVIPISTETFEAVIAESGKGVEASLIGFRKAVKISQNLDQDYLVNKNELTGLENIDSRIGGLLVDCPSDIQHLASIGLTRVEQFQNPRYGEKYLARLRGIFDLESRVRMGDKEDKFLVTREVSKNLAVLMAFDDIIKVAGLKSSPSRFIRIRDEVKADQTDLVKIFDFFKPGLPEIAGVLPSFLSRKLIAFAEKRAKSGLKPIAFPIKVRSHSVSGFLLLRFVAGLKFLRPFGARFKDEQRVIDVWLKSIRVALSDNQSLAYEIARSGKLIKGYGETNERGKKNFLHILENVVPNIPSSESDAGKVVASLIEGALKDEGGVAFAKAVEGVGMAAPVPTIRPIRWFKKTDLKKQS